MGGAPSVAEQTEDAADTVMRVAIHQPYFLPWLGYFSRLFWVDAFIVLDDVQFRKRHYIDRTRIVDMQSNVRWVGVPVGEHFGATCREVVLRDDSFKRALLRTIAESYATAERFDEESSAIAGILDAAIQRERTIVDIDVEIALRLLDWLDVKRPAIYYSSAFSVPNEATARIAALCEAVSATSIVIGNGGGRTVHDWSAVAASGVEVLMHDYMAQHPVYAQTRRKRCVFQPGLSVIDALMNTGRVATRGFITAPDMAPVPYDEALFGASS
jgi:hypothetical protein